MSPLHNLCFSGVRAFERHLARRNPLLDYLELGLAGLWPFLLVKFIYFQSMAALFTHRYIIKRSHCVVRLGLSVSQWQVATVARRCEWNYTRGLGQFLLWTRMGASRYL